MEIEKLYFVKTVTACFLTTDIDEFVAGCDGCATIISTKEVDLACLNKQNWVELYNNYSKINA